MIKFENPTNGRYYYLFIQNDMFNKPILTLFRGGNQKKVIKKYNFESNDQLMKHLKTVIQRRIRNGYMLKCD